MHSTLQLFFILFLFFVLFFPACITCRFMPRHCLHIFRSSFKQYIIHYLSFTIVHYFVHTHTNTHTPKKKKKKKKKLTLPSGCYGPTDHRPSHITRFLQPLAGFILYSRRKFVPYKCVFLSHKHYSMVSFI